MYSDKELVSIIVPIYNVDKYLKKCLDTILAQTYKNLEIILVNDGSTDMSSQICEEYEIKDSRIVLINQKNGGLSVARNSGIGIAKGRYIGFVDSDDYIYANMYEDLVNALETKQADVAECFVENVIADKETGIQKEIISYYEMSGTTALSRLMQNNGDIHPRYAVWNKLFRREVIEDLKFPQGEVHEDYFYDALALLRVKKYVIISRKLYCHRTRPNSITSVPFNVKDYDKIKHIRERTNYLLSNGYKELAVASQRDEYETLLDYYHRASEAGMTDEKKRIKRMLTDRKSEIKNCGFSRLRKNEFLLFYFNPSIYVAYRKMKNSICASLRKD